MSPYSHDDDAVKLVEFLMVEQASACNRDFSPRYGLQSPLGAGATLGTGGGRSRAGQADSKPCRLWAPSQKGLFSEKPQRHRLITVRPARPKTFPSMSVIVNSPSIRIGPLLLIVTLAGI